MVKRFKMFYLKTMPYALGALFIVFSISECYIAYCSQHPHEKMLSETLFLWALRGLAYPLFILYAAPWLIGCGGVIYLAWKGIKNIIIVVYFAYEGLGNPSIAPERTFNSFESLLWIIIGGVLAALVKKKEYVVHKRQIIIAAILFVLFGASDIVEVYSGAWWTPWWLLVWKTLNAISLLCLMITLMLKIRRARKSSHV